MQEVTIRKLVHGGQGLGELADGRKVFVWNALPGEKVRVRLIRQKRSYAEGIAEDITTPSSERVSPREENYLATSPWQILDFAAENRYKKEITKELFRQAGVWLPEFTVSHNDSQFHYRNKMEYSFYGDETGLHLALHRRGTHQKHIVDGSILAMRALDEGARSVRDVLHSQNIRAGDLKSAVVRCSQDGKVAASLFVKPEIFPDIGLPQKVQGIRVYYSNPKSPASVPTKLLYERGSVRLADTVLGTKFTYDVDSFFQVNVPVFTQALTVAKSHLAGGALVDMYAGAGVIGLSLAEDAVRLIELDAATAAMARHNAEQSTLDATVIEASTEKALEYVDPALPIVFDPPRAGMHPKLVERVLDERPPQVIYLSCNPATQGRDLALLQQAYRLTHFEVFNFFPRTPHIESLAIMRKKT